MRSSSFCPASSKRHSSTLVAWAVNRAKLTPRPSQVAPKGNGLPSLIFERRGRSAACKSVSLAREVMFMDLAPKGREQRRVQTVPAPVCGPPLKVEASLDGGNVD